jgi:hypothetical protein
LGKGTTTSEPPRAKRSGCKIGKGIHCAHSLVLLCSLALSSDGAVGHALPARVLHSHPAHVRLPPSEGP